MPERTNTGIFILDSIENHHDKSIDFQEIVKYINSVSPQPLIWQASKVLLINPFDFARKIKENNIKRFIIAGHNPGIVKSFFSRAMQIAGQNAENIILVNINKVDAIGIDKNKYANALILCAIHDIPIEDVLNPGESAINPDTLVIGGGISGIQASLEIANAGQKVYLVEKTGTIGGYMATFDKTFPTLDCAACILTPKMVEVGQHANINLMTYSEVLDIKGNPGNYTVRILKKARYVDLKSCIGCGTCAEKCPVKVPSEFDAETTLRKAIYIPFPQAVPNKYLIDAVNCTKITKDKCGVCAKFCPVPDCISFDKKDEEIEITVGNIILATGYQSFKAARDERFGYGKFPNVVTSLEFERMVNASGPTGGNIVQRTQDKKGNWIFEPGSESPESIAIIHCVGSRDENFNRYCSKVCCMYSLKLAHLVAEKLPNAEIYEYYIDIRAFGKGYEEFYKRIRHEGVHLIRGRTAKVEEKEGKLWLRTEDIENGKLIEQLVDMVILAVGLEPREDAKKLAQMAGISVSEDGWFREANYNVDPTGTDRNGISIAGVCQGPKDIPDSVAQASAAAAKVIQTIMRDKIKQDLKEIDLSEIESRISELKLI